MQTLYDRKKFISLTSLSILSFLLPLSSSREVLVTITYKAETSENLLKYLNLVRKSNLVYLREKCIGTKNSLSELSACQTVLVSKHRFSSIEKFFYFRKIATKPGIVGKKERLLLGINRTIHISYI